MKAKVKRPARRWVRVLLTLAVITTLFIALVIIFISPITRYLVEKYDVKYTGREITIGRAYVNPFTGHVHFSNVKFFEQKSDSIFFSVNGLDINISMFKLLSKTYEISTLTLDEPRIIFAQNNKRFNISDLIERFSSKNPADSLLPQLHLNILKIVINEGEIKYIDQLIPINYFIRKVNLTCPGIYWNADTINVKYAFLPMNGEGDMSGEFMINIRNMDYRFNTLAHKLDLSILDQYMKELANYGKFTANLDADLNVKGNFTNSQKLNVRGMLAVNDFHFGKTQNEDYASFKSIRVSIRELDPGNKVYFFDSVRLEQPYFTYENYDYLDNIQRMFVKDGSGVTSGIKFNLILEIARYIRAIFGNFLLSDYKINSLVISKGDFQLNDYSKSEKFSATLNPFNLKADSIDNTRKRVELFIESGIKPYGSMSVSISANPKRNTDFDFTYKIENIPAALFNPYLISYTSFPLDRGEVEMFGVWHVRNDIIESTNHIMVIDPRVTKRLKKRDSRWLPLPLIMAFVREKGNVIDYQIPITANIKNPAFHYKDVILDLVKNIFIKPPTTAHRIAVKNTETEIEKLYSLSWAMRQTKMIDNQDDFMNKIAKFLKHNPDAKITVHPFQYAAKEKEYILFFEAKKKYFLATHNQKNVNISKQDSLDIEKMSSKDAAFVKYLDAYENDSMLFTIQDKCTRYVGAELVNARFNKLIKQRENAFLAYFKENQTEKQVKLFASANTIPFNGFSYFNINYTHEIPRSLQHAYDKLDEINSESTRKTYEIYRKGKGSFPVQKEHRK